MDLPCKQTPNNYAVLDVAGASCLLSDIILDHMIFERYIKVPLDVQTIYIDHFDLAKLESIALFISYGLCIHFIVS